MQPSGSRAADQGSAVEGRPLAVEGRPLDLIEGIVPPPSRSVCERWPKHLRLRGETLEGRVSWVRGRCKATNLCDYCARASAVETSEMLWLDACAFAPGYLVVLTAREFLERAECRRHLDHLRRSLKKRWPAIEWAVLVEFQRRGALHLNLLLKGIPEGAEDAVHDVVAPFWCARVDAEPWAQSVTSVYDGGGVIRYLAHHFNKPSQAPPRGWRGHRFSCTRGYLARPAGVMREEARRSLRMRAIARQVPMELVELAAQIAEETVWELWEVRGPGAVIEPFRQVVREPSVR